MFQRLPEIKDEFTITISKGIEANKVIKIMTSSGSIPADYVKETIESADIDSALTYSSKLDEFVSLYLKEYIDPVISVIEVKNYDEESMNMENIKSTDPKTKIVLNNIATTKDGKLDIFLDEEETIGYNFIRDNINQMIIPIKCDNGYASISVIKSKTKKNINKDYKINTSINVDGVINEYNCNNKINEETIKELENGTNKKIKNYINKVMNVKTDSEFLGFKRDIYLKYPKYKNEKYKVDINVKTNLSRKGEINNSSKGDKNGYKD